MKSLEITASILLTVAIEDYAMRRNETPRASRNIICLTGRQYNTLTRKKKKIEKSVDN